MECAGGEVGLGRDGGALGVAADQAIDLGSEFVGGEGFDPVEDGHEPSRELAAAPIGDPPLEQFAGDDPGVRLFGVPGDVGDPAGDGAAEAHDGDAGAVVVDAEGRVVVAPDVALGWGGHAGSIGEDLDAFDVGEAKGSGLGGGVTPRAQVHGAVVDPERPWFDEVDAAPFGHGFPGRRVREPHDATPAGARERAEDVGGSAGAEGERGGEGRAVGRAVRGGSRCATPGPLVEVFDESREASSQCRVGQRMEHRLGDEHGEEVVVLGGLEGHGELGGEAPTSVATDAFDRCVVARAELDEGTLDGLRGRALGSDRGDQLGFREATVAGAFEGALHRHPDFRAGQAAAARGAHGASIGGRPPRRQGPRTMPGPIARWVMNTCAVREAHRAGSRWSA